MRGLPPELQRTLLVDYLGTGTRLEAALRQWKRHQTSLGDVHVSMGETCMDRPRLMLTKNMFLGPHTSIWLFRWSTISDCFVLQKTLLF